MTPSRRNRRGNRLCGAARAGIQPKAYGECREQSDICGCSNALGVFDEMPRDILEVLVVISSKSPSSLRWRDGEMVSSDDPSLLSLSFSSGCKNCSVQDSEIYVLPGVLKTPCWWTGHVSQTGSAGAIISGNINSAASAAASDMVNLGLEYKHNTIVFGRRMWPSWPALTFRQSQ